MRVGLIYDPVYLEHDTGTHVENAQRLVTTMSLLEESQLKDKLPLLPPRPATVDELSTVHAREYISRIQNQTERGGGWLDADTVTSPGSYKAAIYAAGGVLTAVEAVMNKQVDSAFALVRPPGHHATCWQAMGFCLFNNIAIATKYALANFNIKQVLIVDFDVHHGNSTQDTFYTDPHVLYFSTHQYPFYPGTGSVDETGAKNGEGLTVNVPLIAGWGDEEYQAVFEDILAPVAERFQPQLILVSAGYDAHWADSIALMQVSVPGFARMVEIIKTLADRLCQGHLVFTLEGGYHLQALPASIRATLDTLLGEPEIDDPLGKREAKSKPVNFLNFIRMVKDIHHINF
ncbi:MAG TPA: histone deacetylase [Dehalococcoidia bacterium]|nr:histone deacetylase [Dehalococcoidia bacterium]